MARVYRRGVRLTVVSGALAALLCGCSTSPPEVMDVVQLGSPQDTPSRITINPQDGASGVAPSEKVTASVAGGQLTQVALATADGVPLAGALSPDGERWASVQPLRSDTSYVLRATARSTSGQETTSTSRFSTLAPSQRVTGTITPDGDAPVGADDPVTIRFDKAIGDRAAVERALRVTANPAANGATEWRTDRELVWRPTPAWPPGSQVTVTLDMFGKQLGNGLVGGSDLRTAFTVRDYGGGVRQASAPGSASPSSATRSSVRSSVPSSSASRSAGGPAGLSSAGRLSDPTTSSRPSTSAQPSARSSVRPSSSASAAAPTDP